MVVAVAALPVLLLAAVTARSAAPAVGGRTPAARRVAAGRLVALVLAVRLPVRVRRWLLTVAAVLLVLLPVARVPCWPCPR